MDEPTDATSDNAPDNGLVPTTNTEIGIANEADLDLIAMYLQRFDRKRTRIAYREDIEQFFGRSRLVPADVRAATFLHLNQHIANLEDAGLKASTIKRKISALRGFFDWLEALELIDRNPADRQLLRKTRTARGGDRKIVFLSRDECRRLVLATDEAGDAAPRDRALVLTMLHCVLRRSEAAAMNVEHVRPLGRYWILDLPQTKGGNDQFVKIPENVVEAIEVMKDHYGIRSGALWRSLSNRNRGDRLTPRSIYNIVSDAAARAGLDDVGAHTLRHTGCTLAIESGASVQQVKAHARHKNLETTMMYVHQREKLRDSAADFIRVDEEDEYEDE